jgi:hypothetical protein
MWNITTAIKDLYTAVTPPAHISTEDASTNSKNLISGGQCIVISFKLFRFLRQQITYYAIIMSSSTTVF